MRKGKSLRPLLPFGAALAFEAGFALALAALERRVGPFAGDLAYLGAVEVGAALLFLAAAALALRREGRELEAAAKAPLEAALPRPRGPGSAPWRRFAEGMRAAAQAGFAEREASSRAEIDSFLETVHALKTPAAALSLMAERAEREGRGLDPAELRLELDELNRMLDRALGGLRLHDFERGSRPSRVEARVCVRAVARKQRRLFQARGLALSVDGGLELETDPEWLAFILGELLSNAAKYASSSVSVGLGAEGGEGRIEIRDDGPGFDGEDLARGFGRSASGSAGAAAGSERLPASSGYGLYLAAEAARRLGARLELSSPPGGGGLAVLALPLPLDPLGERLTPP